MGYLGTKPANSPLTSELIPDGMIGTSDLANGAVTQDKLSTYIAPKGTPAFSAYMSSNQTISSNTWTKLTINTEEFDTNSNFDTSTYRFTPTVAGYYQVNASVNPSGASAVYVAIYKNGSSYKVGQGSSAGASVYGCTVSTFVYCNGTTDYIELYTQQGNTTVNSGSANTWFQASMVRAA